jgi:error-prone DNA polymerase
VIHLHVHSWFSFLASAASPEALAFRAAEYGHEALALTDDWTMAGAVRHAGACRAAGIKPLYGAQVCTGGTNTDISDNLSLVLLCADREGYANLCDLLTLAHRNKEAHRLTPRLRLEEFRGRGAGLFALVNPATLGPLEIMEALPLLRACFGERLFIELVSWRREGDRHHVRQIQELASSFKVRTVATNAVRYLDPRDYVVYDALTCARLGVTVAQGHPERPANDVAFFCDAREFRRRGLPPASLANTRAIARECTVDLLPGAVTPPAAALPEGVDASRYLRQLCVQGFRRRYPGGNPQAVPVLEKELRVIRNLQLDEFFLVVREVVEFARSAGIRCSGRGSAANSLVAFLLGITEVDPIRHKLLFERFLHEGRRGMPDIDVDFDSARRNEVIAWMGRRWGEAHTAMTANVVTFRLRMAVREMAKILGYPLSLIDRATKLLPHASARRVQEHRKELAVVFGESMALDVLCALVEKLHGCPRHLSLHSGGMILSREPLRYLSPIQTSANGVRQMQFAKDDVEQLGLIKFDVLGLRMLSVIAEAKSLLDNCSARSNGANTVECDAANFDIDDLPPNDPATYNLIRAGHTLGVFQIESPGQWRLLAMTQPECFDDLVAQVALFRPGPLQGSMVNPFVLRRRGLQKVRYPHPSLEGVLNDTYGVILFQEQVLEIAHVFAGMSLSEADDFRRLMSKFRDAGEMEAMRGRFVDGAIRTHGVRPELAHHVFDLVSKFVGYGFCRSHAAAFARTVYQSAYLKAHHPAAYMAAVLEHLPGFYPLQTLLEEARRLGVRVLPPCIMRSGVKYQLEEYQAEASLHKASPELAIRIPFSQVREISPETAALLVLERLMGSFVSLEETVGRLPFLSLEQWENLARSGALSAFGERRRVLWQVRGLVGGAGKLRSSKSQLLQERLPLKQSLDVPLLPQLTAAELTAWDFQTQALSAGPHPLARHRAESRRFGACCISDLETMQAGQRVLVAGIVISRQRPPTARGMTFLILEDESGRLPTALIPPLYEKFHLALRNPALLIEGKLENAGIGGAQGHAYRSVLISRLWPLESIIGNGDEKISSGAVGHPGKYPR